jgi:spermidine synthase
VRWFQEKLHEHHSQLLSVDTVFHRSRTGFQEVMVFENQTFGKVLVLDGVMQLTERDNHIYHEMIAHVPLMAHGCARRVLIIGGGDGGTLREVLKHPVSGVFLVELDPEVIDLSRRHLPEISDGAFDDPRVHVIVRDGAKYVAESESKFDIIIVDSTDPVGPGESLFSETFYRDCRKRLRPGGIIAVQSGAPFFQPDELGEVCRRLSGSFGAARPFLAPVPTYAGGMLALVAAGEARDMLRPPCKVLRERYAAIQRHTRYYTLEVHRAAFTLAPSFAPSHADKRALDTGHLRAGT